MMDSPAHTGGMLNTWQKIVNVSPSVFRVDGVKFLHSRKPILIDTSLSATWPFFSHQPTPDERDTMQYLHVGIWVYSNHRQTEVIWARIGNLYLLMCLDHITVHLYYTEYQGLINSLK